MAVRVFLKKKPMKMNISHFCLSVESTKENCRARLSKMIMPTGVKQ